MLTILLSLTMAISPIYTPPRPHIVSDQWRLIDNGKRWKQTVWYSDGSRKCFIVEIPKIK